MAVILDLTAVHAHIHKTRNPGTIIPARMMSPPRGLS